ncbi:MAG: contractile injection system protein, VgrG/Pvc8 family [Cyanobacteria bacterium P01_D01_bin.156]
MIELGIPPGIVTSEAAITIDGDAQLRLTSALLSVTVVETTEGLYRCEARFGNWGDQGNGPDYLYFDRQLLDFGKEMTITLGAGADAAEVFKGKISAIEGQFLAGEPPQIVVLAEDAAQSLRQTRRTRTFEDMSDGEVFEQIASDYGLQSAIDVDATTCPVIAQLNQSDLAFVRERARRLAAEIWIEDNTLHVQSRQNRQQSDDQLTLAFNRGLLEFSVTADTANQYTQVVVSGWDVQAKERFDHKATDSIIGSELEGDTSAAQIVREIVGGDRTDRIAQQRPLTSAETQSVAEASFRAQARRFVMGTGIARGDARIRVGRTIALQGLGPLFSGAYYVSEVQHCFSRRPGGGYTTELVVERPGIGT